MTEKSSTIGEELVLCKKCSVVIYTEFGLVCAGPCSKAYHVSCACVRKEDLRAQSRGFMWMCGDCSHALIEWKQSYHKSETPNDTTLHTEIAELKSQVSHRGHPTAFYPERIVFAEYVCASFHSCCSCFNET